MLPTGVAIALPDGYAAFVHPRSGLAARCGVALVNAPGTVDAGYRGEIKVIVVNLDPRESVRFERFDRIAQLVVQQVEKVRFHEVAELPGSAGPTGGFGSTGGHAAVDGPAGGTRRYGYASVIRPGRTVTVFRRRARSAKTPSTSPTQDAGEDEQGRGPRRRGAEGVRGAAGPAATTCRPPRAPTGRGTSARSASPARAGSTSAGCSCPASRAWSCGSRWPATRSSPRPSCCGTAPSSCRRSPHPSPRASGARSARRSPPASPSRAASSTRSRARWAGSCGPRSRCSCRTAPTACSWCASSAATARAGSCAA